MGEVIVITSGKGGVGKTTTDCQYRNWSGYDGKENRGCGYGNWSS